MPGQLLYADILRIKLARAPYGDVLVHDNTPPARRSRDSMMSYQHFTRRNRMLADDGHLGKIAALRLGKYSFFFAAAIARGRQAWPRRWTFTYE